MDQQSQMPNREAWVVVALDYGKVKQCTVRTSGEEAAAIAEVWQEDYGASGVCLAARVLDSDTDLTPGQLEKVKLLLAQRCDHDS